jgi:hypothetical protein
VHVFEYTAKGWREVLVDLDDDEARYERLHIASLSLCLSSSAIYQSIYLPTYLPLTVLVPTTLNTSWLLEQPLLRCP